MKYIKWITFSIYLLISINIFAKDNTLIKTGINVSDFRNNDSHFTTNFSIGLSKIKKINKNLYFLPEIFFTREGSILKNKPVKNDDWEWYLNSYNIKIIQYYLELPLMIGYHFIFHKSEFMIYFGPSFKITITDRTKLYNEKIIYDDDHPEKRSDFKNYNFEFVQGDYSGGHFLDSPGMNLNIGFIKPFLKKFYFEIRYSYSLNKIGSIGQLNAINRKLHSLHFLIGVNL